MRIAQINTVYAVGSTGNLARSLVQVAREQGHEAFCFYGRPHPRAAALPGEAEYFGNRLDCYAHILRTRLLDQHGKGSRTITRRLIRKLRNYDPDIIHLHNVHGYYLNLEILTDYLKQSATPVIWTMHDCWLYTGHCAYYTAKQCRKWQAGCSDCPAGRDYPASWFRDASRQNYHWKRDCLSGLPNVTFVPPSQWLANETSESFLRHYPVRVIHNGIDTELFWRSDEHKPAAEPGAKPQLIAVANYWEPRKNLEAILYVAEQLRDSVSIVVVGKLLSSPEDWPDNVRHIAQTANPGELATLYAQSDLLLNPTLEDNFPTVNIEAVAGGTPVITYSTGGSPEAMFGFGEVLKENSPECLVKTVTKWLNNAFVRPPRPARSLLAKETMVQSYLQLYEEIYVKGR